jgi:hypothetical protein
MKHITTVAIAMMAFSANVQAFTAFAFSETANPSRSFAVVTDVDSLDKAKLLAVESCAKNSGKKDCKVLLTGTKPGFGAIYGTCVTSEDCFFSFGTGYRSRNAAHDGVLAQCRREYGVTSCMPYGEWQETVGTPTAAYVNTTKATEKRGAMTDNRESTQALQGRDKLAAGTNMSNPSENRRPALTYENKDNGNQPKWMKFSDYSGDGYVDINTMLKNGREAKLRVLRNHFDKKKTGDGISYQSDLTDWEFNCKEKTARKNRMYLYSEKMGNGNRFEVGDNNNIQKISSDFMNPTTVHDSLFYFACGTPGGYKNFSNQSDPDWFRHCDHRPTSVITVDDIHNGKKKEMRQLDSNSEVEKLKAKRYGQTIDLGKGLLKLSVVFPGNLNGPYDAARNPGISVVGDTFKSGEMMFHGRLGGSRIVAHVASAMRVFKGEWRVELTPEHAVNESLKLNGFDVCRAEKVEWSMPIPQGGRMVAYKANGYSIYNGTEKPEDKDDRLAIYVVGVTFPAPRPGEVYGYSLMTTVYENDLSSYEANPRSLEEAARAEFEKVVRSIKVSY